MMMKILEALSKRGFTKGLAAGFGFAALTVTVCLMAVRGQVTGEQIVGIYLGMTAFYYAGRRNGGGPDA